MAPLFRFKTDDEAIEIANGTAFGLAAYYYTENIRRSWRVAERLEFGMVGLNTGSISVEMAPFGGVKQSGFGREGSHHGIDEYLQVKAFHLGDIRNHEGHEGRSESCPRQKNSSSSPIAARRSSISTASCGTCRRSPMPKSSARTSTRRCSRRFTRTSCLRPSISSCRKRSSSRLPPRLPEEKRTMIVELADNHARHIWLQQEGAYHLGLAVGRRFACGANLKVRLKADTNDDHR